MKIEKLTLRNDEIEEIIFALQLRKDSLIDTIENYDCEYSKVDLELIRPILTKLKDVGKTAEDRLQEARDFYAGLGCDSTKV